jgi:hypothetical protein
VNEQAEPLGISLDPVWKRRVREAAERKARIKARWASESRAKVTVLPRPAQTPQALLPKPPKYPDLSIVVTDDLSAYPEGWL